MATDVPAGLRDENRGDSLDRLVPVVYEELRRIAHRHLAARGPSHTLTTTGVVHEAYLKLVDQRPSDWGDRTHFVAVASMAMRQILIDRARARMTLKRGGPSRRVTLDEESIPGAEQPDALVELNAALDRLGELSPRLALVVELRFFGGMSETEIAVALATTTRTVQRDWAKARMLLRREIGA